MTLQNQTVVVLGGTSGIGLATAQAAAADGAQVIVVSRRQESIDSALATLPQGATGHTADLSSESELKALFEKLDSFDHLVFTAGDTLQLGPLADTDLTQARRALEVRYWGALAAVKYGAPKIRQGGSIVLTSGIAGLRPHSGWTLGASVCGAMESLTRALAVELAPIRVNSVSPGVVRTNLWSNMPAPDREALYASAASSLPVGHIGEAEQIAETYLYLMREKFSTGQMIVVDGGAVLV